MERPKIWGDKTPSGYDVDLGQFSDMIEKGTKRGRIPTDEALRVLKEFKNKYLHNVDALSAPSADAEERLLDLMDLIQKGVKEGVIPRDEAVQTFEELDARYPMKDE